MCLVLHEHVRIRVEQDTTSFCVRPGSQLTSVFLVLLCSACRHASYSALSQCRRPLGRARSIQPGYLCISVRCCWQVVLSRGGYTSAIDVWSLGCIFGEMLQRVAGLGAASTPQLQVAPMFAIQGKPKTPSEGCVCCVSCCWCCILVWHAYMRTLIMQCCTNSMVACVIQAACSCGQAVLPFTYLLKGRAPVVAMPLAS